MVKTARRLLPITGDYVGGELTTSVDGRWMVTPLFVVLLAIGSIDLLFALDSIRAVFGVTEQPYIVFTANAFALLGLRALFFLVNGMLDRLVYLSAGLSLIRASSFATADRSAPAGPVVRPRASGVRAGRAEGHGEREAASAMGGNGQRLVAG
jgi:Integral membrane protein TerC family